MKLHCRARHLAAPRAAFLALTLVMGLGLAACGGDNSNAGAAAEIWPEKTMDELADAAAKEGEVSWYTVFTKENSAPIIGAFQKAYPGIKVTTLRLSANQLSSRILTEQRGGQFNADVVSGNATYIGQLQKAGALQGFRVAGLPALPSGLTLPEGYEGVVYINTSVLAYNPQAVKAAGLTPPTTWQDLTKPEWKGTFSIDPESVDWYDSLVSSMGHDQALELVKALAANSPRITPNHTQQLTEMQAGETLAAVAAYGPASAAFKKTDPTRTDFVNSNPLPAVLTLSGLAKNPPHRNAAMLFQSWLLSAEGQQVVVDAAGKISIRGDVRNNTTLWDPKTWTPAWADPSRPPDEYNKLSSEFDKAVNP
ncbi:ABC transporter substrate-binding protein [Micromonospora sp. NPDC023966]|uniref:ABC transporter substrate-binding protein n=1 Tax=Micromonospora sp. NPDC023966 TaxID=3154699 RepID=UPI003402C261